MSPRMTRLMRGAEPPTVTTTAMAIPPLGGAELPTATTMTMLDPMQAGWNL